LREYFMKLPQ
jgi:hypothetical protein